MRAVRMQYLHPESVQENKMELKIISVKSETILLLPPPFPASAFSAKYNAGAGSDFKPLI